MSTTAPDPILFNLTEFRARVVSVAQATNWAFATLSKRLFTDAKTLPKIMDGEVPVRTGLDTLLRASARLSEIERDLALNATPTKGAEAPEGER